MATRPAPHGARAARERARLERERFDAISGKDPADLQEWVDAVVAHPKNLAQIVKIDGPMGPEWFNLWPDQLDLLDFALEYRKGVILKARQLGVTWTMMLLALWECIAYPTGTTLVVSINEDESKEALSRAKFMYESSPEWFKAIFPVGMSNESVFSIQHEEGSSRINAISSSGRAGRGRTNRRVIADERAHWENESNRMASLAPSAADFGFITEVSTANGMNGFRDTYMGGVESGVDIELGNGYARMFIGALSHPARTRKWVDRERQILDGQEPGLGAQEYPLTPREAFKASGACIFSPEGLDFQSDYGTEPPIKRITIREAPGLMVGEPVVDGPWKLWEGPRRGRDYLISADVCGGVRGGDYSFAAVWDRDSWDIVSTFHGQPDPEEFADILIDAGKLYTSEVDGKRRSAELVVESNNHGAATCAVLRQKKYPRLYRSEGFDAVGMQQTMRVGWLTTAKTRPIALAALQEYVREGLGSLRDPEIINECSRFVETSTGKWEADTGAHDDRVMGTAIGVAVLARSRASISRTKKSPRRWRRYTPRVSDKTGY